MGAFDKLANTVASQYEKAGMNKAKAESIGAGVAAKQGRKKFGKKKFQQMAMAGRK